MATTFSWSDSVHALFEPCLTCLRSDSGSPPRNRFDDLERLLADTSSGSIDAETLSLHSNVDSSNAASRRRRRAVLPKTITLFGFHLFGRPPIHLPDDDDSPDTLTRPSRHPRISSSTLTLDSDAAPLDAAAIAARAQEEAERAERRARRRERKERRRSALALAMNAPNLDDGAFEGFQGSGSAVPYGRLPFGRSTDGGSSTGSGSAPTYADAEYDDDADADAGDFDAGAYTRRAPPGGSSAGGSDSRSRTSASYSQAAPDMPAGYGPVARLPRLPPKKPKEKSKSKAMDGSAASSSAASTSVASPAVPTFPVAADPAIIIGRDDGGDFEGFPDDLRELPAKAGKEVGDVMPSAQISSGFPSAGFRGGRGTRKSDLGAFLASK